MLQTKRIPISEEHRLRSPLPEELVKLQVLQYDTNKYPFRELVAEILQVPEEQLQALHTTRCTEPLRQWQSMRSEPVGRRFTELLELFVSGFVSQHMGNSGMHLAYQKRPTFRAVPPSNQAVGIPHCDSEYHHPPAEVNWWLPVTDVYGSNTLHTETYPGSGSLVPMELEYGQVLRFYGNKCWHRTFPNTTEHTRVSFDFRVLALQHHDDQWLDSCGRSSIFKVGAFYKELPGATWDASSGEDEFEKDEEAVTELTQACELFAVAGEDDY